MDEEVIHHLDLGGADDGSFVALQDILGTISIIFKDLVHFVRITDHIEIGLMVTTS